jgi:ectoine hydroxylase-related dioxygenase (phytanoyl-CoA dioxygenase family)
VSGSASDFCASVRDNGFALVEGVIGEEEVSLLREALMAKGSTGSRKGGVRGLLEFEAVRALSQSAAIVGLVRPILGGTARVVRATLFDKTDAANWKVPWHQDVTIAVSQRIEAEGFGPWSVKAGILHVQAPTAILERMISVRVHLDDCPPENGALKVIAGSHRSGRMPADSAGQFLRSGGVITCAMKRGGVLLMRPLLFHASSAATAPSRRRVIHFDYAATGLPVGMDWAVDQA